VNSLSRNDPSVRQFLTKISPEVAATFTDAQLDGIRNALASRRWNRHPVDIRFSTPIPGLRFYIVLIAGKERRSRDRLRQQHQAYPLWTPANILVLFFFLSGLLASGLGTSYWLLSYLRDSSKTVHPAAIPWISNAKDCQKTGRVWKQDKCLDYQHNHLF
jgi:hypothetical protein